MLCADVLGALEDDLNTPKAITALHELRREAAKGEKGAAGCLKACAQFMGLLNHSSETGRPYPHHRVMPMKVPCKH